MVAPNGQALVKGRVIFVTLLPGQNAVTVNVKASSGGVSHPQKIDIGPLLAGGLDEAKAIQWVLQVAIAAMNGAD